MFPAAKTFKTSSGSAVTHVRRFFFPLYISLDHLLFHYFHLHVSDMDAPLPGAFMANAIGFAEGFAGLHANLAAAIELIAANQAAAVETRDLFLANHATAVANHVAAMELIAGHRALAVAEHAAVMAAIAALGHAGPGHAWLF